MQHLLTRTHRLSSPTLRVVGNFVESSALPSCYHFLVYKCNNVIKSHFFCSVSQTNRRLISCVFQIMLTWLQQVFIGESYMTAHSSNLTRIADSEHILIYSSWLALRAVFIGLNTFNTLSLELACTAGGVSLT